MAAIAMASIVLHNVNRYTFKENTVDFFFSFASLLDEVNPLKKKNWPYSLLLRVDSRAWIFINILPLSI